MSNFIRSDDDRDLCVIKDSLRSAIAAIDTINHRYATILYEFQGLPSSSYPFSASDRENIKSVYQKSMILITVLDKEQC